MSIDPAWVGIGLLVLTSVGSSVYTVRRNTKDDKQKIKADAAEFGVLKDNVADMKGDVAEIKKSLAEGLTSVGKEIQAIQVNCAKTSTALTERVSNLEEGKKREGSR